MASLNPFDLLGDEDTEDPTQLIAKLPPPLKPSAHLAAKKGSAPTQPLKPSASVNLPSKPLPPAQAVREAKNDAPRGGRGGFRGGRGFNRDSNADGNSFGYSNGRAGGYRGSQEGDAGKTLDRHDSSGPRGGSRGGRRGGFSNGDVAEGERPRRAFERRSGTGRGNDFKREGAGRGNWGTPTDENTPEVEEPVAEGEKVIDSEKLTGQEATVDADKDANGNESKEKEPEEDKEMTLEEYEKLLEEKRQALPALKPEQRKVNLDKEFESMQLLSNKKNDEEVFAKLGSEKDKRKDAIEKAKKSLSINEFLKPAEGETFYRPGGRGRGRGQGRGGGNYYNNVKAPSIADVGQFPALLAK